MAGVSHAALITTFGLLLSAGSLHRFVRRTLGEGRAYCNQITATAVRLQLNRNCVYEIDPGPYSAGVRKSAARHCDGPEILTGTQPRTTMTTKESELLTTLWVEDPVSPFFREPWQPIQILRRWMLKPELMERPDLGWALALRLVKYGWNSPLLDAPAFGPIRMALTFIGGGGEKLAGDPDFEAVVKAWEIHRSQDMRHLLHAMLLPLESDAETVAEIMGVAPKVVETFGALFFNVLDRREDLPYLRKIIKNAPAGEADLLMVGLNGTVDDVMHAAGCGGHAAEQSVESLTDRVRHNMMAVGAAWTVAPGKKAPPALVAQAMAFVQRPATEFAGDEKTREPGAFSEFVRAQLEADNKKNEAGGRGESRTRTRGYLMKPSLHHRPGKAKPAMKQAKKRARANGPDVGALERMGVSGWAALMGVQTEMALAMSAAVLTGVAGPETWLDGPCGPTRLAKLNLLTVRGRPALQRMIDCLVDPASLIDRRLIENIGQYHPDAIGCLTLGPFAGAGAAKFASADTVDKTLNRHQQALNPGPADMDDLLQIDLEFNPLIHRQEAINHPGILLKHTRGRDLVMLSDRCNARHSLLVQPLLELERVGPEPHLAMKELLGLIDGTAMSTGIQRPGRSPGPARAQAILTVTPDDLTILSNFAETLLLRVLWLADRPPAVSAPPLPAGPARVFAEAYQRTVEELVDLRRQGRAPIMGFTDDQAAIKFETMAREYEAHIETLTTDPGPSARGLPATLFWTMAFFRRSLPDKHKPTDGSLMTTAFKIARTLLDDHVSQMRILMNARQVEERKLTVGRIVQEIMAKESMALRNIVRLFFNQKRERFEPVLQALVETGVLILDELGFYRPGPVDLADAEETLALKFADSPVSHKSGQAGSGKFKKKQEGRAKRQARSTDSDGIAPIAQIDLENPALAPQAPVDPAESAVPAGTL